MINKTKLKASIFLTTGIIVASVGFGSISSADGSMWRNDRNTVKLFPTTLATQLASTTVSRLQVTTSNTATSTATLGCVQTVATSTATPIRLLFTASTTATAISGTQAGFVLWGYGTCPF